MKRTIERGNVSYINNPNSKQKPQLAFDLDQVFGRTRDALTGFVMKSVPGLYQPGDIPGGHATAAEDLVIRELANQFFSSPEQLMAIKRFCNVRPALERANDFYSLEVISNRRASMLGTTVDWLEAQSLLDFIAAIHHREGDDHHLESKPRIARRRGIKLLLDDEGDVCLSFALYGLFAGVIGDFDYNGHATNRLNVKRYPDLLAAVTDIIAYPTVEDFIQAHNQLYRPSIQIVRPRVQVDLESMLI